MSTVIETTEIDVPTISEEEARRREILLRAAELIEERGYTSGTKGMTPDGEFCLVGAVGHAMGAPMEFRTWGVGETRGSGMIYRYDVVTPFVCGSDSMTPWSWSDSQKWKPNPEKIVARVLRRLANGMTWEEAAKPGPPVFVDDD